MVSQSVPETALTWTALLNIANTVLIVIVGFFGKEAWNAIHRRIDQLENRHGDMRERVASLEAVSELPRGRRSTDREES